MVRAALATVVALLFSCRFVSRHRSSVGRGLHLALSVSRQSSSVFVHILIKCHPYCRLSSVILHGLPSSVVLSSGVRCRPSSVVAHWSSSSVVVHRPLSVICGHPSSVVHHLWSSVVHCLWSSVIRRPSSVVVRRLSSVVVCRPSTIVCGCLWSSVNHCLWSPRRSPSSIVCDRPLSVIVALSSRQPVIALSILIARWSLLSRHQTVGCRSLVVVGGRWSSTLSSRCCT